MPYAVAIDSIYFPKVYLAEEVTTVRILDPPFIVNYYRLVYFINKIQQKIFYILDDGLSGSHYQVRAILKRSDIKLARRSCVGLA